MGQDNQGREITTKARRHKEEKDEILRSKEKVEEMKRHMSMVVSILAMVTVPAWAELGGVRDSATFGFKYECDGTPGTAGFLEGTLTGAPVTMTASGGILNCGVNDWFDGSSLFRVTPSTNYTVEFRSKTLSAAGTYPGYGAMFSNSSNIIWISVGTNQVKEAYTQSTYTGMDNASDFHTYRIAYEAEGNQYTVWRDSQQLAGAPTKLGLDRNYGTIFQFGNLSTAGVGASQVDYIRWDTTGAYAPTDISSGAFPGTRSTWHGFDRYDFTVDGFATRVVAPEVAAPGNPWVMRGEFEDYHTEVDEALLAQGYHIVFTQGIVQQFGSPAAVSRWDALYETMTTEYGLSEKAVLEGISRSGLLVHNWAVANPEKVACILGYVPVCDFKSWPAGPLAGGVGVGNTAEWENLKNAYGFTSDAEALAYGLNPIDTLGTLAAAGIRILQLVGAQGFSAGGGGLGGYLEWIVGNGGDHGAWISDVSPIVNFVMAPEPGALSLLMLGGVGLLRRR